MEVHIVLWEVVGMDPIVGIADVDARLAAVTADRLEPRALGLAVAVRTTAVGPRAVVLRPGKQITERVIGIERHALELQRCEPVVHRRDHGGDRRQPRLAVREVVAAYAPAIAVR